MKTLTLTIVILSLVSCSTTRTLSVQKLKKGTKITTYKENSQVIPRTHDIYVYEAKTNADVNLKIEESKIRIGVFDLKNDFKLIDTIITNIDFDDDSDGYRLLDKYAYSSKIKLDKLIELDSKNGVISFSKDESSLADSLKFVKTEAINYSDNKFVFQTLTIPFKLRSKKGDTPSSVSTGFNAGIAYGYQWNLIKLNPIYDTNNPSKVKMSGYDKKSLSFALSPFAGLTPVSLKPSNTNNDIEIDQTVLGVSFGGAGVFTFNRVNLGLALGLDYGLNNSKNWIYQGEFWTGIVIGLDLIK